MKGRYELTLMLYIGVNYIVSSIYFYVVFK